MTRENIFNSATPHFSKSGFNKSKVHLSITSTHENEILSKHQQNKSKGDSSSHEPSVLHTRRLECGLVVGRLLRPRTVIATVVVAATTVGVVAVVVAATAVVTSTVVVVVVVVVVVGGRHVSLESPVFVEAVAEFVGGTLELVGPLVDPLMDRGDLDVEQFVAVDHLFALVYGLRLRLLLLLLFVVVVVLIVVLVLSAIALQLRHPHAQGVRVDELKVCEAFLDRFVESHFFVKFQDFFKYCCRGKQ